ncbi:MAG: LacI family transcriptional regulator [Streptococcaceae bacterium]|jgi:LacI family transcriptional regulator|nr:LacI family transcriptional regulator [Streptococcaceae bacterium]
MKKITLKQISKLADVSPMTVSNVIRGKDTKVSAITKAKIEEIIRKYNYAPNQNAANLRSGRSNLIGVLFYNKQNQVDFIDPFISAVLTGIEQAANDAGYFTMLHTVSDVKSIEALQRNWVFAGFVVISLHCQDFVKIDKAIVTPVSYIDTYWDEKNKLSEKPRNFIGTDEEKVSRIIADYLKMMGHEKILFYSFDFDENEPSVIQKRYQAFLKYFPDAEAVKVPTPNYQAVLESVVDYLELQPFTAIYATADLLAARLNQIFKDISIIGVDDADFDSFIAPKLTTVRTDQLEKGRLAVKYLLESIERGNSAKFYSDSELIERDSVRNIKKNEQK